MCGRYVLTADPNTIQQTFNLEIVPVEMPARYNIAPSQPVAVISNQNSHQLDFFKWGLVPSWAKDPSIGNQMINARSETAHEKPAFRSAFKRRRCLIPANGFYEWSKNGKSKSPLYIHLEDQRLFAFAGLWEVWHNAEGDTLNTCTILTTEPNDFIKPYHHRMAIIMRPENYAAWLSADEISTEEAFSLLAPYDGALTAYEVSKLVNSPANDALECIAPLRSDDQLTLL